MKHYLGIDLGGTKIAAGVVDENYQLVSRASLATGAGRAFDLVLSDIVKVAQQALEKASLSLADMRSLGIGTPSCINPKTGLLVFANSMCWENAPVKDQLTARFGRHLSFANDADCAALGESLAGAAKSFENVVMVTLGTGVGGGIILNGQIFNGCDQMGAEVGHTTLVFEGEPCSCGKRGCLEAYASGSALVKQTQAAMKANPDSLLHSLSGGNLSKVDGNIAFLASNAGDPTAMAVIDRYLSYVAAGIANLVTIFRPKVVLIGGGVCQQGDALLNPINQKLEDYVFAYSAIGAPKVRIASLGNDAGIIGAAMIEDHLVCCCRFEDA